MHVIGRVSLVCSSNQGRVMIEAGVFCRLVAVGTNMHLFHAFREGCCRWVFPQRLQEAKDTISNPHNSSHRHMCHSLLLFCLRLQVKECPYDSRGKTQYSFKPCSYIIRLAFQWLEDLFKILSLNQARLGILKYIVH